ncbi:MAG TPA: DUF2971 domain-containing protein, partial [Burkholderiaceae bacterium]
MNKPKTVFKYENFTVQSIRNLKAQIIYFGSPLSFNDPYDCALQARVKDLNSEEIEKVRGHFLEDPAVVERTRQQLETVSAENLKAFLLAHSTLVTQERITDFLQKCGVACFSESNNDLLMWSHYGGRYKGFCLEFSTAHEPFEKIRKVEYAASMPEIDLLSLFLHDEDNQFLKLLCTKSQSWSYEKEWRCIHN